MVRKDSLVSSEVGGEDRGQDGYPTPEQEGCASESMSKSKKRPACGNGNAFVENGLPGGG